MYKKLSPHKVTVENEGTVYIWQCGKTGDIPFCNGSHAGTDKTPLAYEAKAGENLFICGCGKSKNMPFCDGSHKSL